MLTWPALVVRHAAVNVPSDAAWTTAIGTQLAPGVAGSWSISTAAPASPAGTVPVTDTPVRRNAEALEEIVIPSLVALTGTFPAWTLTFGMVLDAGEVPAPPDPAQASPGITRAPAPAASSEAKWRLARTLASKLVGPLPFVPTG